MIYLQFIGGVVVLLAAAELFVRGALSLSKMLNVPPLVIGMTVVAFGTSAPELGVTLDAALSGAPGLALGNIIGSNITNVLLILGASCLLSPIKSAGASRRDGIVLVGGSLLFALLVAQGELGFWSGAALLAAFLVFLGASYRQETIDDSLTAEHILEVEGISPIKAPAWVTVLTVLLGLAGIILGAELLVEACIKIAREYKISEEIIGLTVVALGTSLPELAASGVAAYRGHSDIAVGNVVGSNLFNILGVIGLTAVVAPLPVMGNIISFDLWVMLGATALVLPILAGRWHPGRLSGIFFLLLYGAYITTNAISAGLLSTG